MGYARDEFPNSSYYKSDLREIIERLKHIDSELDEYDDVINQLREALENIQGMDERIRQLEINTADLNKMRSEISTLFTDIDNIINQHEIDVERLQKEIDNIKLSITSFEPLIEAARAYSLYLYNKLKTEVSKDILELTFNVNKSIIKLQDAIKLLNKRIDEIDTSLTNPWHPELNRISLNRNNKFVYSDLSDECLTANQYATLGLTADQYSAYDLSAINYAEFGKTRLHYYWVFSPTFGFKQEINNVLTSIVNAIMDTLTATEFTALDLTADDYTALDMTAWQYYNYMADEGFLQLGKSGITASQYSTIGV